MLWVHQKQQEYPRRVTNIFFLLFFCFLRKRVFHGDAKCVFWVGISMLSLRCSSSQQQRREAPGAGEKKLVFFCYSRMYAQKNMQKPFWEPAWIVSEYILFSTILFILVNQHLDLRKVLYVQVLFDWLDWKKTTHLNGGSFWDFTLSTWRRDACVALCTRALRVSPFMESSRSLGLTELEDGMMELIES